MEQPIVRVIVLDRCFVATIILREVKRRQMEHPIVRLIANALEPEVRRLPLWRDRLRLLLRLLLWRIGVAERVES